MTEVRESIQSEPPVLVALLGDRLGSEIKELGSSFKLSDIYGEKDAMVANDRITQVYFRTQDGNICRLDDRGNLTNANESQKRGTIVKTPLEIEDLKGQKLTVGEPFFYGSRDNTRITEIVTVVAHRLYTQKALQEITNGRTNTIIEDFQQMLPSSVQGKGVVTESADNVGQEDPEELREIQASTSPQVEKKPSATPPTTNLEKETKETIEGIDTKNTKQENQEAQNVQSKELEQKADELAKATRENGMGELYGKFPPRLCRPSMPFDTGYTSTGDFIQGEQFEWVEWDKLRSQPPRAKAIYVGMMISMKTPGGLRQRLGMIDGGYEHIQIWTASNYEPPVQMVREKVVKRQYAKKELFGLRKKTVIEYEDKKRPTDTLCSYNGKHGEADWIQYDYFMPVDSTGYPDSRRFAITMSIAVPPDIAALIDQEVNNNVYFPDAFFKALYPNTVAPTDLMHDIKRVEAKQLQIVDLRQKPYKEELRPYPQPIPY